MVIYNLVCKKNHSFEGWFPSFQDFQKQADKKLISCPTCGSTKVEKVPHACAVHVKKEQAASPAKKSPAQTPAPSHLARTGPHLPHPQPAGPPVSTGLSEIRICRPEAPLFSAEGSRSWLP